MKVFGSFGYFYDIMKYNLPRGSFGGDYWHDCVYALDTPDFTSIIPQRDSKGHYCPLGGGAPRRSAASGRLRFIENFDYREPANDPNQIGSLGATGLVDPNLKPMKQHDMVVRRRLGRIRRRWFSKPATRANASTAPSKIPASSLRTAKSTTSPTPESASTRSFRTARLPAEPKADPQLRRHRVPPHEAVDEAAGSARSPTPTAASTATTAA